MRVTLKILSTTSGGANTFYPPSGSDDPMYPKKNKSKTQAPVLFKPGPHTPVQKNTKYPKTSNVGSDY